ncbi:hypothetical protein CBL_05208 [Carabus blaptoides fortunei]
MGVKIKSATDKADTIRLHVETCKDFRTTTKLLEESKIPFHTFALNDEKLLKVVIKGIPTEIPDAENKEDLELQHLPVEKLERKQARTRLPTNSAVVTGTSYASRASGKKTTPVATTSVANISKRTKRPPQTNNKTET